MERKNINRGFKQLRAFLIIRLTHGKFKNSLEKSLEE